MLLAPKIAPISFREIGEQNPCSLAEYWSRDRGWGFISAKDDYGGGNFSNFEFSKNEYFL
jgi:hypothetical protein